jgi:hypothetical protein
MKYKVEIFYSFVLAQEIEANTEQEAQQLARQLNSELSDQDLLKQVKDCTEVEAIYIDNELYR